MIIFIEPLFVQAVKIVIIVFAVWAIVIFMGGFIEGFLRARQKYMRGQ